MILISLTQDGIAVCRYPQQLAQGTNSENIVLASPFPARVPILMGWVMPDGTPLEQWVDPSDHAQGKTKYFAMTNVIDGGDLGAGNEAPLSLWTFRPDKAFTAQYGTAYACFYAQLQDQNGGVSYRKLTTNLVAIEVLETIKPDIDDDVPEGSLLEEILQALTYYNEYLGDISENGVSTVHDTEGEAQREVYTDSEATEGSDNLITSDGAYKAAQGAVVSAKSYTDEKVQNAPVSEAQEQAIADAEQSAKEAAQGYANTAETNAKTYTDQQVSRIPKFDIKVVQTLPTEDISETTVYLVPADNTETGNIYTEYIYVDGTWEVLGTQSIDLSGYTTDAELQAALNNYVLTSALQSTLESYATKTYADNAAAREAADALNEAKSYTDSVVVTHIGTTVYEDGTAVLSVHLPKVYNSINEVDASFDGTTTLQELIDAMSNNSNFIGTFIRNANYDKYNALLPAKATGVGGVAKIFKRTNPNGEVVVSAKYEENGFENISQSGISFPIGRNDMEVVQGEYLYTAFAIFGDATSLTRRNIESGVTETIPTTTTGYWSYVFIGNGCIYAVGRDGNDKLKIAKIVGNTVSWEAVCNDIDFSNSEVDNFSGAEAEDIGKFFVVKIASDNKAYIAETDISTGVINVTVFLSAGEAVIVNSNKTTCAYSNSHLYIAGTKFEGVLYDYDITQSTFSVLLTQSVARGGGGYGLFCVIENRNGEIYFCAYNKLMKLNGAALDEIYSLSGVQIQDKNGDIVSADNGVYALYNGSSLIPIRELSYGSVRNLSAGDGDIVYYNTLSYLKSGYYAYLGKFRLGAFSSWENE